MIWLLTDLCSDMLCFCSSPVNMASFRVQCLNFPSSRRKLWFFIDPFKFSQIIKPRKKMTWKWVSYHPCYSTWLKISVEAKVTTRKQSASISPSFLFIHHPWDLPRYAVWTLITVIKALDHYTRWKPYCSETFFKSCNFYPLKISHSWKTQFS